MDKAQALTAVLLKNQLEKITKLYFKFAKQTHRYHHWISDGDIGETTTGKTGSIDSLCSRCSGEESL